MSNPALVPVPEAHAPSAQPRDHHPDGTPMTQEEIDAFWLTHVYKPDEPQLTPRAVITGMLLGGVMSLSNLYVGLKTGWGLAVTVTAAVLAFGFFSALKSVVRTSPFARDFTSLENNTMASAASAAGYFTGAGLTSAIPALFMATGKQFAWWELTLWILAISFLGVLLAVPMRRQMIDVDRLPFPEGLAYAETIRSLHAAPGAARKKALALLYGALAGGGVKLLTGVTGLLRPVKAVLEKPLLPEVLPISEKWAALTIGIQTDILMIGAGAMMGLRIGVGLLVGAIAAWGVLGPWLFDHGLAGTVASFATVRTWLVWPGVAIIVVNGLLAFALKWRTALAAVQGLGRLASGTGGGMADVEVPAKWFVRGTLAATAFVVILAKVLFDIPIWMGLLATVLSILLSIVACRATGETSITPIGALGKITQFMYGGLAAGNIQTNLMTASITAGAAMHSADLLTDLKGGYVLGGKPRNQFVSQFFGILAGAVFCIPAYMLLATPERLGSQQFPAPAAKTWQAVAELLAGGIETKTRGQATLSRLDLTQVPMQLTPSLHLPEPGATVRIAEGPNAGTYTLVGTVAGSIYLSPPLPDPAHADGIAMPDGATQRSTGSGKTVFAARSAGPIPEGTKKGDYLRATTPMQDGREIWWGVKGLVGDLFLLDRPLVDPLGGALEPAVTVDVRKESLPPYASSALFWATLVAILLTLIEVYAPPRVRRWVPSATGIGLGFVVNGFDSISMFLGALIAWALEKWRPAFAENYTLAGASGVMAGASLAGIVIIVFSQVVPWLATP